MPSAVGNVLGVIPVDSDDRNAPAGAAALREVRGVPLLCRAVAAVAAVVGGGRIVVACPPSLVLAIVDAVEGASAGAGYDGVQVVGTPLGGHGNRVRSVLSSWSPAPDTVVVHDPLHALASADLVRAVMSALVAAAADVVAAVPVRAVTDTLKWVGADDVVAATVDREGFCMTYTPQAFRGNALTAALDLAGDGELRAVGADAMPRLMQHVSGRLVSVSAPGEVFRIATDDDLHLADAMLHVGAHPHSATR